jgi:hypothetical protein
MYELAPKHHIEPELTPARCLSPFVIVRIDDHFTAEANIISAVTVRRSLRKLSRSYLVSDDHFTREVTASVLSLIETHCQLIIDHGFTKLATTVPKPVTLTISPRQQRSTRYQRRYIYCRHQAVVAVRSQRSWERTI